MLAQQQATLNTEAAGDRAAARAPNPLDDAQTAEALRYFRLLEDPSHDFSKLPGVALAGAAEEGAAAGEEQRTALGASRFGAAAVDPNLQAAIAATLKDRRIQRRGEMLDAAVNNYDARMRGTASELAARDAAKKAGMASNTSGLAANATNAYTSFQPRPAWGLTLATSALGAAGGILSGIKARPSSSSAGGLSAGAQRSNSLFGRPAVSPRF